MVRHGFEPLPTEWWHFDYAGWEKFPVMNVDLRELSGAATPSPPPH